MEICSGALSGRSLPPGYLECLRKGLAYANVESGIVVLPLGKVAREEWIPQAADFALQIEGAEWASAAEFLQIKCDLCAQLWLP